MREGKLEGIKHFSFYFYSLTYVLGEDTHLFLIKKKSDYMLLFVLESEISL